MKSFTILLSFVSLITATPLAFEDQIPLNAGVATYPGFNLDLNALRLVQTQESEEPVWMTELEKVVNLLYCCKDTYLSGNRFK